MSTLGTPVLNLLSLIDSSSCRCRSFKTLISSPHNHFPIISSTKPLKTLTFTHSIQQKSYSITTKNPNPFILFVAQTSDWAQQEEDNNNTVSTIEQQQEEQEEVIGNESENESESFGVVSENWGSQNESEIENESGEGEGEGEGYIEPPEEAKIFVGNLPYEVDSERLAMLFEQAGTVEIAEVIYNRETDRSRGFGFVTMSTVEEADKAVDMFHRYDLDGRFLTVNKAAPKGTRPDRPERPPRVFEPAFRIYVGNLPWDVDDARLEQVFSEHGKVVNARVVYERETGRSRGFGFVTMASETEMNDAIAALDGQSLDGRAIRVNVAEERPRRASF